MFCLWTEWSIHCHVLVPLSNLSQSHQQTSPYVFFFLLTTQRRMQDLSSLTRDPTCAPPAVETWSLNYRTTREVPDFTLCFIGQKSIACPCLGQTWQKNGAMGLPWWRSGWESACQCRGCRFEPWSGKIPRAAEQLGPWATTTEPARLEPVLRNKRGRDSEWPTHHDEEWPPLAATRESPRTETKTQHSQK